MNVPSFKFGVSEFTTWPWTFDQDRDGYKAAGADSIEICEFKLEPGREREQIRLAIDMGLEVSSVQPRLHSLYPDQPRPLPSLPAERMALYRKTIDIFGDAAPGTTLVSISGSAIDGDYRTAFETAVREYRLLAEYAADHGVRIALEPLNPILMNVDTFISTIPAALEVIDAVDHPSFGIWIDVWHIWQDPAAIAHIASCGDRIFGVHVNDWHRPRHFGDRAVIGEGEIDLPPLLRAIHNTGYAGTYCLEIFSVDWLPDSLWKQDLNDVVARNRVGLEKAWQQAFKD